ncbi:hypothetical protein Cni_G16145 [Canna indica]|uniref:Uncharacterized protein n=1 Tax=Canna indica TaxID=4628 RepID=A0AAQ3KEM0_9LILI|nr:hypothetical protein Cni_G16145 [Canna indica]
MDIDFYPLKCICQHGLQLVALARQTIYFIVGKVISETMSDFQSSGMVPSQVSSLPSSLVTSSVIFVSYASASVLSWTAHLYSLVLPWIANLVCICILCKNKI